MINFLIQIQFDYLKYLLDKYLNKYNLNFYYFSIAIVDKHFQNFHLIVHLIIVQLINEYFHMFHLLILFVHDLFLNNIVIQYMKKINHHI